MNLEGEVILAASKSFWHWKQNTYFEMEVCLGSATSPSISAKELLPQLESNTEQRKE
jgi:hypothetical protein